MRKPPPSLVIMLIGLLAFLVDTTVAQESRRPKVSDEEAIRALEEQERMGVLNRDLESLRRIWSEQLMVNAPTNRVSPDRNVALNGIETGMIHYSSFERKIEGLRIEGDIAIVMGAETITPTGKAPRAGETVQRRFTHIWRRGGDTWRLIARHASILPPE